MSIRRSCGRPCWISNCRCKSHSFRQGRSFRSRCCGCQKSTSQKNVTRHEILLDFAAVQYRAMWGSFLPFAALWSKVRSDAPLAHSTITPATPSPYAPALPPAHSLSHSWQPLCWCCARGWPGRWPQDSQCCAACLSCGAAGSALSASCL